MKGAYDVWLILLSFIVAVLTSYTALDLSGHISRLKSSILRYSWITGGAIVMGVGIWSMHFIGMLAFSLPIPLGYDFKITGYSLIIAILLSYGVLYIVTQDVLSSERLVFGGTLMGLAIAGMHYCGMAAMKIKPGIHHDPMLFSMSIIIAVVAASLALWIVHELKDERQNHILVKRIGASCVMGIAITGMHYTGMAAAYFPINAVSEAAGNFNSQWLVATIFMFTFGVLSLRLMLSSFLISQLNNEISRITKIDLITDLPNHQVLIESIQHTIVRAKDRSNAFAILFVDLGRFKIINESLGHLIGDKSLKVFAQKLQECISINDMAARLSGGEFIVFIDNIESPVMAEKMATSILEHTRGGFLVDGHPLQVVPNIGITLFPQDGTTAEALINNADIAMYAAKRSGHSNYRFYEAGMQKVAAQRF